MDFNKELFPMVRNLIKSNRPNHPWLALNDDQLFATAGLYKKDFQTNKEGYTLAAALLFGKDIVIQNILPHYKIDAVVRIQNTERYDDRLIITTNLIDAYDRLMEFIEKHLPDKFYMEGTLRVSLREKIFREVIANLIVHREYTNAYPASMIIYSDRVEFLNANNPNGSGPISVKNFSPFPKNPTISKFFVQLGRVEELGSGIINVERYLKLYSPNSKPEFIEDYVFKTIIPIKVEGAAVVVSVGADNAIVAALDAVIAVGIGGGVNISVSNDVKNKLIEIINFILLNNGARLAEIEKKLKLAHRTAERNIQVLRKLKIIEFAGVAKTGRYIITKIFMDRVNQKEE